MPQAIVYRVSIAKEDMEWEDLEAILPSLEPPLKVVTVDPHNRKRSIPRKNGGIDMRYSTQTTIWEDE
ncbi:unnamed protein product [Clonostachys solani]|uniref:Uncharacterized protein n=1 Tax=Clonostachys solani TaxID=160281 RepID=A0A9P0EFI5_9HYPO|nr:unnamed protein product [Clonostachys solani]